MKGNLFQILFIVLISFSLFRMLAKSPTGQIIIWVIVVTAAVVAVTIWMLRNNRPQLARIYPNPAARFVVDTVCRIANEQPLNVDAHDDADPEESPFLIASDSEAPTLAGSITEQIFGHDAATGRMCSALCKSVELRLSSKSEALPPLAAMLMIGHSGIGKRLLATQLAHSIYAKPTVINVDLADYDSPATVSTLLGGATDDGIVPGGAIRNPYTAFIFENPSRADPKIMTWFQRLIAHSGKMVTVSGKSVSFQNCALFFIVHGDAELEEHCSRSILEERLGQLTGLSKGFLETMSELIPCGVPDASTRVNIVLQMLSTHTEKYNSTLEFVEPEVISRLARDLPADGFANRPAAIDRLIQHAISRSVNKSNLRIDSTDLAVL